MRVAFIGQAIGPVWFFYRKSYLLGFAFIILTFVVGMIASTLGIEEVHYIMFFIYLLSANKLYLWDVRRKVNRMVELNKDKEKIIKKGGTSKRAAIIYGAIFIEIIVAYMALILYATALVSMVS